MNRTKLVFWFIITMVAVGTIGCEKRPPNLQMDLSSRRIAIITYKSHPVLDQIVNSTIEQLTDSGLDRKRIEVFNPNGNLQEVQNYVRSLTSSSTNLIISVSTPASQAVLSARHPSIPVLFSFVSDPRALRIDSIQSPKQNVTGLSNVLDYENGFHLLKEVFPSISRIGVLYNPSEANSFFSFNQIKAQADNSSPMISVVSRQFYSPGEIQAIVAAMPEVQLIYVGGDNTLVANINLLLTATNNKHIPVFASDEGSVRSGAIAAYSINYADFGKETADMAIQVLKNGSAGGIQPKLYKMGRPIVNTTALKKFGLKLPSNSNFEEIK